MKDWLDQLRNMHKNTRWSLGIGLGVVLVLTVGLGWWASRPVYSVLYQDLSDQDLGQIAASLDKWHVAYRLGHDGGSIEVPEGSVADARMRLATEGVPSHGTVGLEIFDNADYGMTDFAQKVNYQRAIQGELERTIMALKQVRFARVYVTMKQSDLFIKDEEAPKASVTIAMREGEALSEAQIDGIQNLVAAAVQGLDPKSVIVVDDRGIALSGGGQDRDAASGLDTRLQEQSKIEQGLRQKVMGLLEQSLGLKDVSVSVSVLLNFDHVKRTEQKVLTAPDGNGFVLHKQETSNDAGDSVASVKPVPKKVVTSSSIDYENGKSYEEVDYAPGRVQRITVGVIVPSTLPVEQQTRLREVISAAAGLDATRGDEIQLAFMAPTTVPRFAPVIAQARKAPNASEPGASGESTALPLALRWALIGALLAFGASLTIFSLLKRRPATDKVRREAVLADIKRWLGEAGD